MIQGVQQFGSKREFATTNLGNTTFANGLQRAVLGKPSPTQTSLHSRFPEQTVKLEQTVKPEQTVKLELTVKPELTVNPELTVKRQLQSIAGLKEISPAAYKELAEKYSGGDHALSRELYAVQDAYIALDFLVHPSCLSDGNITVVDWQLENICQALQDSGYSCKKFRSFYKKRRDMCVKLLGNHEVRAYQRITRSWDSTNFEGDLNAELCPEPFRKLAALFIETIKIKHGYVTDSFRPLINVAILRFKDQIKTVFERSDNDIYHFRGMLQNHLYVYACDQDAILIADTLFQQELIFKFTTYASTWMGFVWNTKWWLTVPAFETERSKMAINFVGYPVDWIHIFMLNWVKERGYRVRFPGDDLCRPSLHGRPLTEEAERIQSNDNVKYRSWFG